MATQPTARPQTSVKIIQTSGNRYVPPGTLYAPPKPTITGIEPATSWWTAGQPILPIAPPETSPRGFQFLSEQNKIYTPRATEYLTFDDLRRLASYPLAAIMITEHANQIAARKWAIRLRQVPGMTQKKREQAELNDTTIRQLTDFFMNPNPDNTWREFCYQWMTEIQTTDAPALFVRRNKRRDIGEIRLIDGTMIARYVDDNGWTPTSESPAYAQLWWGIPAWDLTRDQLLYRPKCPRVYKIYGNSPTERMHRWLELGWSRLELKLQWAENGTIPDGLMVVPPDAPMELVERQQAWMNAVMTGNFQRRVQLRLIQGFSKDGKDQLLFPKEKMLMDPYDEYEIRVLAVGYGFPKQRLMQMMTRSTAETAQEAAEEEGYWPSEQYVMDSCNMLIQSPLYFNKPQYEFTYAEEREKDVVKQATADDISIKNGSMTWNEARDARGFDRYSEGGNSGDLADGPLAFVQGVIYNAYESAGEAAAAKQPALPAGEGEGKPGGEVLPPENPKPPKKYSRREVEESNRLAIAQFIQSAKANHQFEKVHPGASINPHHFSLQSETARGKIAKTLQDHFEKVAKKIVAKIKKTEKVRKSDEDDIKKLLGDDDFWQSLWISLPPELSDDLEDAVKSGMSQGMLQLDVNISSSDTINKLNAIARDEARKRAAEMVGMKFNEEGELVPNSKAQFVISDTTRNDLREIIAQSFEDNTPMSELIQNIQDAGAFSSVRAQMIAKTEVSRAQAGGTYQVWKQTGVVKTCRWQNSNLEGVCPECQENADAGEINFGEEFPSGDLYPPAHISCRCVVFSAKTGKAN